MLNHLSEYICSHGSQCFDRFYDHYKQSSGVFSCKLDKYLLCMIQRMMRITAKKELK